MGYSAVALCGVGDGGCFVSLSASQPVPVQARTTLAAGSLCVRGLPELLLLLPPPSVHRMPSPLLQLPALTTLVIDRCFARDLTPLAHASRLDSLHLSYDCWAIMGVTFPPTMAALKKLRLMAALQVRFTADCTWAPLIICVETELHTLLAVAGSRNT